MNFIFNKALSYSSISSPSIFSLMNNLAILNPWFLHINFRNSFIKFQACPSSNSFEILMGILFNLFIYLGRMTLFFQSIHEYGTYFHLYRPYLISFTIILFYSYLYLFLATIFFIVNSILVKCFIISMYTEIQLTLVYYPYICQSYHTLILIIFRKLNLSIETII